MTRILLSLSLLKSVLKKAGQNDVGIATKSIITSTKVSIIITMHPRALLPIALVSLVTCELLQVTQSQRDPAETGDERERLQIVFVQDRTLSFRMFSQQFATLAVDLVDKIGKQFPHHIVQFGYTVFADYPMPLRSSNDKSYHLGQVIGRPYWGVSCYELKVPLTADADALKLSLQEIMKAGETLQGGNDEAEAALTGLLYTAADLFIGWDTSGDDRVKKILVLVTDEYPLLPDSIPDLMGKPHPKGDGYDTCLDFNLPDYKTISNVLKQGNFTITALLVNKPGRIDVWRKTLAELGVSHSIEELESATVSQDIISRISESLKRPEAPQLLPPPVCVSKQKKGGESISVQIAVVQDLSRTFQRYTQQFADTVEKFVDKIMKEMPEVRLELGYTVFADFDIKLKKDLKHDGYYYKYYKAEPKTSCYELVLPLTTDCVEFKRVLRNYTSPPPISGGDDPRESVLTGLFYTAADLNMKWDKSGSVEVVKLLWLATEEDTTTYEDAPKLEPKPRPTGDGHDTCTEHSLPEFSTVSKFLAENRFSVIGTLGPNSREDVFKKWGTGGSQGSGGGGEGSNLGDSGKDIDVKKTWDGHTGSLGVDASVGVFEPVEVKNEGGYAGDKKNPPSPADQKKQRKNTEKLVNEAYDHIKFAVSMAKEGDDPPPLNTVGLRLLYDEL